MTPTETFKLDCVAGKWQVRMLGPDMRPCLTMTDKRGNARQFATAAAANKAARSFQAALVRFAKF